MMVKKRVLTPPTKPWVKNFALILGALAGLDCLLSLPQLLAVMGSSVVATGMCTAVGNCGELGSQAVVTLLAAIVVVTGTGWVAWAAWKFHRDVNAASKILGGLCVVAASAVLSLIAQVIYWSITGRIPNFGGFFVTLLVVGAMAYVLRRAKRAETEAPDHVAGNTRTLK